jgi:glycosyltransferase involved in cell wall biosynthesis
LRAKVCHVTTGHSLLDDRIFHKEALSLSRKGYRVSVLGPSSEPGKEVKGIRLEPVTPSRFRWRPLAKLFLLSKIRWKLMHLRCRIYHCHEMDAVLAALPSMLLGSRIVYDVHEHFPENYAGRLSPPWLFLLGVLDRLAARMANMVITVDETLARKYRFARRVLVVHNYPKLESYPAPDQTGDRSLAVYVGGLSEERGIWEMVDGLNIARREWSDLRLLLVGRFIPESLKSRVESRIEELDLSDAVQVISWTPFEEIPGMLAKAGIGISFLRDIPRYRLAIPIKVFEYMAAGLPVIASSFQNVSQLLLLEKCGITAHAGSAEALAEALVSIARNPEGAMGMGKKGRTAIEKRYNWESESTTLCRSYEQIQSA